MLPARYDDDDDIYICVCVWGGVCVCMFVCGPMLAMALGCGISSVTTICVFGSLVDQLLLCLKNP